MTPKSKFFMMALMFAAMDFTTPRQHYHHLTEFEKRELDELRIKRAIERKKRGGLQLFEIGEYSVWALNLSNARRKVANLETKLKELENQNTESHERAVNT